MIVDSDAVMAEIIASLLRDHAIFFRIMKVENGIKALKIMERVQVDLVITGLRIPEADSVTFIKQLKQDHPDIKRFVLTDVISPALRSRIDEIGVSAYIEEPANMDELTEFLLSELEIQYGGRVRGISLSSFAQMLELEGITCSLCVRKNNESGDLYFKDGNLVAARLNELKAKDAAVKILEWENILIDIDYSAFEKEREISTPLMNLLLESHKTQDERKVEKDEQRQHPRFDCQVDVDFDISEWSYDGVVKNISLGGVYIETHHPVTVGNEISLTLTHMDDERHCNIRGTVVRRDAKGIGVQFHELSLYQQKVVQSYLKLK